MTTASTVLRTPVDFSTRRKPAGVESDVLLQRAAGGDAAALVDLFDDLIVAVYRTALLGTGKVRVAERITSGVIEAAARDLRHGTWRRPEAFRLHVLRMAEARVAGEQRSALQRGRLDWVREALRRVFLVGVTAVAAAQAGFYLV